MSPAVPQKRYRVIIEIITDNDCLHMKRDSLGVFDSKRELTGKSLRWLEGRLSTFNQPWIVGIVLQALPLFFHLTQVPQSSKWLGTTSFVGGRGG